tara:strand:+ start:1444 stop:1992 length:549 start_codon:yes stop_codon:yes gene_type:complete
MQIKYNTTFPDVILFIPKVYGDHRGFFMESFNQTIQNEIGLDFVQDNHSKSSKYVLRGLHYQWNKPMGKLLRVVRGSGLDVIVDIRKDSSTYGQWQSFELSESNNHILWVPAGFAQGFLSLQDATHLCYKTTALHNSDCEGAINPIKSGLDIDWKVSLENIILSEKDTEAFSFQDYNKKAKF